MSSYWNVVSLKCPSSRRSIQIRFSELTPCYTEIPKVTNRVKSLQNGHTETDSPDWFLKRGNSDLSDPPLGSVLDKILAVRICQGWIVRKTGCLILNVQSTANNKTLHDTDCLPSPWFQVSEIQIDRYRWNTNKQCLTSSQPRRSHIVS